VALELFDTGLGGRLLIGSHVEDLSGRGALFDLCVDARSVLSFESRSGKVLLGAAVLAAVAGVPAANQCRVADFTTGAVAAGDDAAAGNDAAAAAGAEDDTDAELSGDVTLSLFAVFDAGTGEGFSQGEAVGVIADDNRNADIQFLCEIAAEILFDEDGGIAVFHRNDFDVREFTNLSDDEKDEASLKYIETSLLAVCSDVGVNAKVVKKLQKTCQAVREEGFEHIKLHKKTTKWHRSKKAQAVTTLHFRRGGIDSYLEFSNKLGDTLERHKIAESRFWEVLWSDLWKGTWEDETYVITDRFGKVFAKIECVLDDAI